jgi:transposase
MADSPGTQEWLRPYQRLDGKQREAFAKRIAALYREGASIRDIAKETGRSYGAIHGLLVEEQVTMRSRGGARLKH